MTTEGTMPIPPLAEDVQPAEPAPALEESPPPPIAPTPPPGQPVAEQGVSNGSLVCTVCLRPVVAGETYVKTAIRGINHLEPCSHRA